MSTEQKDTITVELPIEARGTDVDVAGSERTRANWRAIAANPDVTAFPLARALAPAVVAWIERDEFKPLGIPEVGRTIKATKRNGKTETFQTSEVMALQRAVHVYDSEGDHFGSIPLTVERAAWELDYDITAWDYVESDPAKSTATVHVTVKPDMTEFIEGLEGVLKAARKMQAGDSK